MSFLSRLLRPKGDDRAPYRPLWHRTVELARDPRWYAQGGIADTVGGRFDTITLTLCAVLLRMESEPELVEPSVRVTELFVEDMDGQLRESGVGDLMVGKHIGRLVSVLGGRLGVCRDALATGDEAALTEMVERNVTLGEHGNPARIAALLRTFAEGLKAVPAADILGARFGLPEGYAA